MVVVRVRERVSLFCDHVVPRELHRRRVVKSWVSFGLRGCCLAHPRYMDVYVVAVGFDGGCSRVLHGGVD